MGNERRKRDAWSEERGALVGQKTREFLFLFSSLSLSSLGHFSSPLPRALARAVERKSIAIWGSSFLSLFLSSSPSLASIEAHTASILLTIQWSCPRARRWSRPTSTPSSPASPTSPGATSRRRDSAAGPALAGTSTRARAA